MTTLSLSAGGRPKRDIIELAFEELGSAGYEFERTPEEVISALRRLNLLMGEWPWSKLGYSAPVIGHGTPEDGSGLPDEAIAAAGYELAERLAGLWGVQLSPSQKATAARAKGQLFASYVSPPIAYIAPNTPRGSGHRHRVPFIREGS